MTDETRKLGALLEDTKNSKGNLQILVLSKTNMESMGGERQATTVAKVLEMRQTESHQGLQLNRLHILHESRQWITRKQQGFSNISPSRVM